MSDPDEKETVSLKITPSLNALIEHERRGRRANKGLVVDVLLRYGLEHSQVAFDEWNRSGTERVGRRKQKPTPLKVTPKV
jgi:hypothetical protein